jgi:hypothetical protein
VQVLLLKVLLLLLQVMLTSSLPIAMLLLLVLLLLMNQSNHLPKMGSLNPTILRLRPLPSNAKPAAIRWILQATAVIAKRPSG